MTTIPALLQRAAEVYGDEPAVVDGATRLSYAELAARAVAVARSLIGTGLEPGGRVAVWAPNSAAWMTASYGVYLAGGVLVPVNTRYRRPEAVHVLRASGARLCFTVSDFPEADLTGMLASMGTEYEGSTVLMSGPERPGCIGWEAFLGLGSEVSERQVADRSAEVVDDSMSDIIFTSGTTGAPKGAVLSHGPSVRTYEAWSDVVGLRRGDRYLVVYPFFHTAGLKSGILACAIQGATVYPQAVFDVPSLMDHVARERINVLPGPPTVFQSILQHPLFETFDISSLRLSVTGAAVVPVDVVRAMRDRLGFETVVTGYGMTETTGTISMCRHDDPPEVIAGTVGRPIPGVEVRVVDDRGEDQPPGTPGEFWVRGFNLMRGYFDDPAATAAAMTPDGWLRTGDVGFVDGSGNLHITDRKKDMFIVGGFNAYPAEIEAALLGHPGVAQVAVVGIPDDRLGEVGVAFVVPAAATGLDPDGLIAWSRERMANFKVPRQVVLCEALPLTASGKVMKHELKARLGR